MAFVVIVDDRATNRSIFSRLASFLEDNVEVEVFSTPDPALKAIDHKMPDLVITDYKMPQMTGATFTQQIRSLPNGGDVPIIVITAYDDRAFRLEALEAGATDFVQTPIDHQEFITRARNLLKIGSRQRQIRSRADALAEELAGIERSRQELLRASREQLAQVIDTLPAMITAHDRQGAMMFSNAHHSALLGGSRADRTGPKTMSTRSDQLDGRIFVTGLPLPAFEEEITDPAGLRHVLLTTKTPLKASDNSVTGVLTTSLDITERKRAEEHLHYLAHHDALTSLPNRHSLSRHLEERVDRANEEPPFAVHFLDLDRFKSVCHAFGYGNGEQLLQAVAQRIGSRLGPNDLIGRLGGDEFCIVQTALTEADAPRFSAEFAETIRGLFAEPFLINGREIHTSVSIGTALFPQDGTTADVLMQHADLAMYEAKARGRNRVCRFEPSLQTAARRAAQLEIDLRSGLINNELILHYQPQLDARSLHIVGVEALLRWQPDSSTLIFPDRFLGMAEEAGLMTEITRWVLDAACRQAAAWERRGMPIRVGINLSASLFSHLDVGALVQAAIRRADVSPHLIDLELTETTLLDDHDAAREQIMRLQTDGVSFCVDDFGTGYASFDYIERLKVNGIKIDQGFVHSLTTQPESLAVIQAIIGLGHAFGIRVIAEGVERDEQLAALQREGCDEVQGYLFSRALPAAEFEDFYARHAVSTATRS